MCVLRSSRMQRQECGGQRWASQVAASMVALAQMADGICLDWYLCSGSAPLHGPSCAACENGVEAPNWPSMSHRTDYTQQ